MVSMSIYSTHVDEMINIDALTEGAHPMQQPIYQETMRPS